MQRRLRQVLVVTAVLAGAAAVPATAWAEPPGGSNGHNCAGTVVSGGAGPGFGQAVSGAAHAQQVDNFGLADCGQENRKNP